MLDTLLAIEKCFLISENNIASRQLHTHIYLSIKELLIDIVVSINNTLMFTVYV